MGKSIQRHIKLIVEKLQDLSPGNWWGKTSAPTPHARSGDWNAEARMEFAYAHLLEGESPPRALLYSPQVISLQNVQACKPRATNGFRTIYDIRPPTTCISIYLVSLTYTLFFQNHKHRCWNFMWKRLRGWKLTPLWSLQPRGGCGNKSLFVEAFLKCFLNVFQVVLGRELK